MKLKIVKLLIFLLLVIGFPIQSLAQTADPNVCRAIDNHSPVTSITYDYGLNGLVRFHYTIPYDWRNLDTAVLLATENCDILGGSYISNSTSFIGVRKLLIQVVDHAPGWYEFRTYDEDTGLPYPVGGLTPFWRPVVGISFGETGSGPGRAWVDSPLVRVKDITQVDKPPVLIVPGVLGTEMFKGNEKLWLDINRNLTDVGDQFMDGMLFNSNLIPINNLNLGEVIKKKTKNIGVGDIVLFDYTDGLINEFTSQGYTEGKDLFTFPYDWRYGVNQINIEALKAKIQAIGNGGKVNVVAHSTGGLLVKKYVRDNPTTHNINKAVFVGVPNTGAPKAIKVLLQGDNFGVLGLSDAEMKKLAQNLPVVYDLAPSQKYFTNKGSFYRVIETLLNQPIQDRGLNYSEARARMLTQKGANLLAFNNAEALHTLEFDNYDLRTAGVDVYNIVGCKAYTLSQVIERTWQNLSGNYYSEYLIPEMLPGDGTVPLESATNLPVDEYKKYYSLSSEHSKMLSQSGTRQKIVNIITGSNLSVGDTITQDVSKCKLNGKAYSVYSPLDISVKDNLGNVLGFSEDGSLENQIPNASFEVFEHNKFVFLPEDEGQTYQINLKGTGEGTFTFKVENVENNQTTETQVFSNIPVSTSLQGTVNESSHQAILNLDINGDNTIDQVVQPSTILNSDESKDLLPPITTLDVTGQMGDKGFYRSNITITLSSLDPITLGQEMQTSGVLKTQYNLNQQGWVDYSSPFVLENEGDYTLEFFSTDKAGNNESVQTLHFIIDKTAPELGIKFNPQTKDLSFVGKDNLTTTSKLTLLDLDDNITVKDQAGNITELKLKEKGRKKTLKAEIKALSYNGVNQDINPNSLKVNWQTDKQGQLKELHQAIRSKKEYNVKAEYNSKINKTKLEGKDALGRINKTLAGLVLLNTFTDKGDLKWEY